MSQYYAIQVQTSYELSVASRLISLDTRLKSRFGIKNVVVPMETTISLDVTNAVAKEKNKLSFTNYVFVELVQFNSETVQFIRNISGAVCKILSEPISMEELQPFINDYVEVTTTKNIVAPMIKKCKIFLSRKKCLTNSLFTISTNTKRTFIKFKREDFVSITNKLNLTIRDIFNSPLELMKGVLLYETVN